jgi:hypothetical protein
MIDADRTTLHIRCGSDIRDTLRVAGFSGDFLEYSDPVCEGPVPDGPDLLLVRARYLAAGPGRLLGLTEAACLAGLADAERRLDQTNRYERVVLWFEHDSHDQLLLARVLSRLSGRSNIELICVSDHPSVPRFNGLGQLDADALAALWPSRKPVTPAQCALGTAIWTALRRPDPSDLLAIARTGTQALPLAAPALIRHLRELPGVGDGLSLTQRIILTILAEAPSRIGRIFAAMVEGREPLVFMGDIGVLGTIEAMARTIPPVLTIEAGAKPFPRIARITETGVAVLSGARDYLTLNPGERWVGGVLADGRWRWDEEAGGLA